MGACDPIRTPLQVTHQGITEPVLVTCELAAIGSVLAAVAILGIVAVTRLRRRGWTLRRLLSYRLRARVWVERSDER